MRDYRWRAPAMMLAPLMLAACAGQPPPETLAAARLQVGQATAPTPESQMHIQAAREKLAAAERAAADEQMARADLLAQEALANVQLARASVQAAEAEQSLQDVERAIQALQAEIRPGAPAAGATAAEPAGTK